jgi:hypothetical protein
LLRKITRLGRRCLLCRRTFGRGKIYYYFFKFKKNEYPSSALLLMPSEKASSTKLNVLDFAVFGIGEIALLMMSHF